ncbi:hypothetical protein Tco_1319936 [Tanacetum coccineum]
MRHVTNHREPLAQYWDVTALKEPKQPMLVVSYQGLAPTRHQLVSYSKQMSHGKLPLLLQLCVLQGTRRSISRIESSSHHEVTIPNPVFRCSEIWRCDNLVVSKSSAVTTADASDKRQ